MKTKWFFHNLSSHLPSCFSSVFSPSKAIIKQDPFSKISTFVLNHVDISLLLSMCGRESNNLHLASSLHASVIKNPEFVYPPFADDHRNSLVVWNSIISAYAKGEAIGDAAKLFDEMPVRDTVSWNTIISAFLKNGVVDHGFGFFKQMRESDDYTFDQATLTTVLTVCDKPEFLGVNKMLHCLVFISGYEKEISVGNALITSYFKCSCSSSGRRVFEEMMDRNVITWTALISAYAQNEFYEESIKLLVKMRRGSVNPNSLTYLSSLTACPGLQALKEGQQIHTLLWKLGIQSDLRIESALMDMYSKYGNVEDAWKIFEDAEKLDEVSMTVVLAGLARNGFDEEAVQFFLKMVRAGFEIDVNVISAILGASGADTSVALAKQLHGLVIKRCFGSNPFVNNGLINMYSKSGLLDDSIEVFKQMPQRNTVSWNSLIAGYARHGDALRALESYKLMAARGIKPTDVTFLSLLHACSHVGLVQQGMELLTSMIQVHGIKPRIEHYSCVIDMLGRAGLLQEAKSFVDELPVTPDVLIWQALMGACSFHGDTQVGNYAAEQLYLAAPESPAAYILMANIYSSKGKWSERARTIKRMKEMGVAKETGVSWIEIEKRIHSFVVEDKMHPEAVTIYRVLLDLFPAMIDHGYKPDKRFILYYLEENKS